MIKAAETSKRVVFTHICAIPEVRAFLKEKLGGQGVVFVELYLRPEVVFAQHKARIMTYVTEEMPIEKLWAQSCP